MAKTTKPEPTSPILVDEDFADGTVFGTPIYGISLTEMENFETVARAQAKKIAKWGDEQCIEHRLEHPIKTPKRMCDKCWAELKKEAEE